MGKIVTFHTKIHLDLTAAMAKRLGVVVGDKAVAEAVEKERMKNKEFADRMGITAEREMEAKFAAMTDEEILQMIAEDEERDAKMAKANADWARDNPDDE